MKIRILDARGKFSATSIGKLLLIFVSIAIIAGAVISSVFAVKEHAHKKSQEESAKNAEYELAVAEGRTFGRFVEISFANSPMTENNTIYIGNERTPIYVGHDTLKDIIDKTGFSASWDTISYQYSESYSTLEKYLSYDSIIDSNTYSKLVGHMVRVAGTGNITLVDSSNREVLEVSFTSLSDCNSSELDFSDCYVTEVEILGDFDFSKTEFYYLTFDNTINPDAMIEYFNDDCDRDYDEGDPNSYSTDSAHYSPDKQTNIRYYCYKSNHSSSGRMLFSVSYFTYCNMSWSEYLEAAKNTPQ